MLKKGKSKKILSWTTKDWVANFAVYVVNVLVICALYLGIIYFSAPDGEKGVAINKFFTDYENSVGFFLIFLLLSLLLWLYLYIEDRNFLKDAVNSQMLFLIMEITLLLISVSSIANLALRPYALCALLVLFLTNRRLAIFMNVMFCMIVLVGDMFSGYYLTTVNYVSYIIGFASGIVAIFCTHKIYSRIKLLLCGFIISVPSLLYGILSSIENQIFDWQSLLYALASGILATAALILLLPFLELIFGRISYFKLAELTDHKSKLIRRMINEAPGTFNHAIVVSNIAEACATAIDEDPLLARACAYYHDIGKLRRPEYFSENQVDNVNPHNDLTPELSTNIIKAHVQDGYQLALKNRLPKEIADVCLQHHGTMPIWYFYDKAKKYSAGEVDIAQYCYLGPKPQTKIAAIIMIADGCEAAARTLHDRSRENVYNVVRNIVEDRLKVGQFDECEITIKELNIIIHAVVNNLSGIYHSRVEYPKVKLENTKIKDGEDKWEDLK